MSVSPERALAVMRMRLAMPARPAARQQPQRRPLHMSPHTGPSGLTAPGL